MEARLTRSLLSVAVILCFGYTSSALAQFGPQRPFVANSPNFIVFASSPEWATQVSQTAEKLRRELAQHWLGRELPAWQQRCPIHVTAAERLGAGGETRFSLLPQGAGNWMMSVQGTPERVLDSVLPHEISHTIFATYFAPLGKYVPRWADEGACTTVEHESEKRKHRAHLTRFLQTGHGLAFNHMFRLKEYPDPILPLYAQGHSVVQFLIDQGGPRKFIQFIKTGMQTESWDRALRDYYAYESMGEFQTLWNQWLLHGSPADLAGYAPGIKRDPQVMLASNENTKAGANGKFQFAIGGGETPIVTLAGNQNPNQSELNQQAGENAMGNESWYKRRLEQVNRDRAVGRLTSLDAGLTASPSSAQASTNIPPTSQRPTAEFKSLARPQPMQVPSTEVLDWGAAGPVSGMMGRTQNPGSSLPAVDANRGVVPSKVVSGQPNPSDEASAVIRHAGVNTPVQMIPIQR